MLQIASGRTQSDLSCVVRISQGKHCACVRMPWRLLPDVAIQDGGPLISQPQQTNDNTAIPRCNSKRDKHQHLIPTANLTGMRV